jgi:hypothetical protein
MQEGSTREQASRPVILLVAAHDERRATMRDELRSRFARDYEVAVATSPASALDRLQAWESDEVPVAMVLADLRMAPVATGSSC